MFLPSEEIDLEELYLLKDRLKDFDKVYSSLADGNKKIFLFKFSALHFSFKDIHVTLPSIREAKFVMSLIESNPEKSYLLEDSFLKRNVVLEEDYNWLTSRAPFGLATSTVKVLLAMGYPQDTEDINVMMMTLRQTFDYVDNFKEVLQTMGIQPSEMVNIDIHDFFKTLLIYEKSLLEREIMDSEFSVELKK